MRKTSQLNSLLPLLLVLFAGASPLFAQPAICVTFNELEPGTFFYPDQGYEAGSLLLANEDFPIYLGDYLQADDTYFFSGAVAAENPENTTTQIFLNYATIELLFNAYPNHYGMSAVCFQYFPSGLGINFGINGATGHFEDFDDPALVEAFPNFDISVTSSPGFGEPGFVCITGGYLQQLTLGGIEQGIDNICYQTFDGCTLNNLVAAQLPCDNNSGPFPIGVNFTRAGITADSFTVSDGQGNLLGTFTYSELPLVEVSVPNLPGDTITLWVADQQLMGCQLPTQVILRSCDTLCNPFNAHFESYNCTSLENVVLQVVSNSPALGQQMVLSVPGTNMSAFAVNNNNGVLYFDWPFINEPVTAFQLYDSALDCATELSLPDAWDLSSCQECFIENIQISPTPCNDQNEFGIEIDFDYAYGQGEFLVEVNDQIIGTYAYEEFPVLVDGFTGPDPQLFVVTITEFNGFCSASAELNYGCEPTCAVDFTVNPVCDGNTLYLNVTQVATPPVGEVAIYLNGELQTTVPATETTIQLGPFSNDFPNPYHILLENTLLGCAEDATLQYSPCNPNCAEFEIDLLDIICTDVGQVVIVELGTTIEPMGQGIFIYNPETGEQRSATFNEYPLLVEWPANEPAGIWIIEDLTTGCTTELFYPGSEEACGGNCEIGALDLLAECRNDGTYDLQINFEYANVNNDFFDLWVNDEF
ncbi:MAG: hypothetical protein KDC54_09980, partial [Lewinella sp.]|nr:hypothetical protein [Lewinella sp.]